MKVILNLTDKQVKDLNEISNLYGESYEEILMKLFYSFLFNPSESLGEIVLNQESKDLEDFNALLNQYLHEAIDDIIMSSESEESYDSDKAMVHVFREILNEHVKNLKMNMDLYETFKKHNQK